MKFELSKKTQSLLDQVTEFINKEIIPNESLYEQQVEEGGRWCVPPIIEEMKEKAKKLDCGISFCLKVSLELD